MKRSDPQMTQMSADRGEGKISPLPLRKSASSADLPLPAAPAEIEVHIEELVLHGFDPRARWTIADTVETELRQLLVENGLPPVWLSNPARLGSEQIRPPGSTSAGGGIASAICGGTAQ